MTKWGPQHIQVITLLQHHFHWGTSQHEKRLKQRVLLFFFSTYEANLPGRKAKAHRHLTKRAFIQLSAYKLPDDTGYTQADSGKVDEQVHGGHFQNTVSYTHLDVYKRQP